MSKKEIAQKAIPSRAARFIASRIQAQAEQVSALIVGAMALRSNDSDDEYADVLLGIALENLHRMDDVERLQRLMDAVEKSSMNTHQLPEVNRD